MTNTQKIGIGISIGALIIGGIVYYIIKKKKKANTKQKPIIIPPNLTNNVLIKSVKEKTDYIHGTLDTMKVVNNEIVSAKTSNPYSIGLLQGVWRIHQEELEKQRNKIKRSKEPSNIKDFAFSLVNNVNDRNSTYFNPKEYNYQAQWYKDYLAKK